MAEAGLGAVLIRESRRQRFDESLPRLRKCPAHRTAQEIRLRPNERTASAGSLVPHLGSSVRQ
jgi:hypothetical protein